MLRKLSDLIKYLFLVILLRKKKEKLLLIIILFTIYYLKYADITFAIFKFL